MTHSSSIYTVARFPTPFPAGTYRRAEHAGDNEEAANILSLAINPRRQTAQASMNADAAGMEAPLPRARQDGNLSSERARQTQSKGEEPHADDEEEQEQEQEQEQGRRRRHLVYDAQSLSIP